MGISGALYPRLLWYSKCNEICGTVNLWRSFYLTTVSHDSNVKLYKTRVVLTVYQFSVLKISSLKKKKGRAFSVCTVWGWA